MSTDGPNYQHLDSVPESTRRLVKIEIMEDLSDSQLLWTIEHEDIDSSRFLLVAATLSDAVSNVINRLALNQSQRLAEHVRLINEACERMGLPSPFVRKTEVDHNDVQSALRGIEEFLDSQKPETDK